MPNKCFMPGCKTGYASEGKNVTLFQALKVQDYNRLNKMYEHF